MLLFWTSTAPIEVFFGGTGPTSILNGATVIQNGEASIIHGGQPDEEDLIEITKDQLRDIELVYLGVNSERLGEFCLITVKWIDGIARRIYPHLLFPISVEDWELAVPKRRLVVLA